MAQPVVLAAGIRKAYRSGATVTPVLQGIDLGIQPGECVILAGPSGSGKSTLLSILGCVLSPDGGTVRVLGEDITRFNSKEQAQFRRERLGFVFQRFHLFHGLRAWENVAVPLNLLRQRSGVRSKCQGLLEEVGLADRAMYHISQLSMGQRQRVALARALVGDPDLILADEPTASLDADSGRSAIQLMRNLADQRGKTVIIVTHDPRIFHFADRVLYLENGRIDRTLPGADAVRSPH